MPKDFADLEVVRDCCKDQEAFEKLQQVLNRIKATHEQSEAALRKSEARNRALLDAIPDLMFRIRDDGTYLDCKAEQILDFAIEPTKMIGKNIRDVLPRDIADQRMHYIKLALATGQMQVFEYQLTHHGSLHHYEARVVVSGVDEVLTIVRDITKRKLSEEALRRSEEKFCKAFRSSPASISVSTFKEGRYIEVNDTALRIFGYNRDEVIGYTATELKIWKNSSASLKMRELLLQDGIVRNMECEFQRKSGDTMIGLVSAEIIDFGGEKCILSTMTDITEHRRAQIELKAALERDRLLGEIALRIRRSLNLDQILHTTVAEVRQLLKADRVFIAHPDGNSQGKITAESVDLEYPSILGWVADEILITELKAVFQGNQPQIVNDTNELVSVSPIRCRFAEQHKVRASLGVPILLGDQFFGVLVAHQCSGPREWRQYEVDLLEKLATQVAIAVQQAELYEQVQALNSNLELQVHERTLQLEQKIKELQEVNDLKDFFFHAVSHDLRTPIMGMLMVLNNLLNKAAQENSTLPKQPAKYNSLAASNSLNGTPQPMASHTPQSIANDLVASSTGNSATNSTVSVSRSVLERMIQSSDRQLKMLNLLLDTHAIEARGVVLQREYFSLSHLINAIAADMEPLLQKHQANLSNLLSGDLPPVWADSSQIRRVVENLITNALNHNPPQLDLTVNASIEESSPPMLCFYLQDNGVGLEDCEQLFERYARGKHSRYSTGIGLGLYLCRQIITAHGGQIGVRSTIGKGATFWFTLPLTEGDREQAT